MGQVVPIHYIPGDIFTWKDRIGVVEDSTLIANNYSYFTSDLTIKSHKTGVFKTFYLLTDILDEDGDVEAWIYEAEDGVQVHILND